MFCFEFIIARVDHISYVLLSKVLNPVIGPEPVSGSSRMKGGSATTVLLDAICLRAVGLAGLLPVDHQLHAKCSRRIEETLLDYQAAHFRAYQQMTQTLGETMEQAAGSLFAGGHVYYIGSGGAGVAGFIDASEVICFSFFVAKHYMNI